MAVTSVIAWNSRGRCHVTQSRYGVEPAIRSVTSRGDFRSPPQQPQLRVISRRLQVRRRQPPESPHVVAASPPSVTSSLFVDPKRDVIVTCSQRARAISHFGDVALTAHVIVSSSTFSVTSSSFVAGDVITVVGDVIVPASTSKAPEVRRRPCGGAVPPTRAAAGAAQLEFDVPDGGIFRRDCVPYVHALPVVDRDVGFLVAVVAQSSTADQRLRSPLRDVRITTGPPSVDSARRPSSDAYHYWTAIRRLCSETIIRGCASTTPRVTSSSLIDIGRPSRPYLPAV